MAASNYLNESNSVSLLFIHICVCEYPYKGFIQQEAKRMNAFANIKIGLSKLVELFSIMNANPFLLIVLVGFTLVLCGNIGKKIFLVCLVLLYLVQGVQEKLCFSQFAAIPPSPKYRCKRHSKLSTQCECTVAPISW